MVALLSNPDGDYTVSFKAFSTNYFKIVD